MHSRIGTFLLIFLAIITQIDDAVVALASSELSPVAVDNDEYLVANQNPCGL